MTWRSILISNPAKLSFKQKRLVIDQQGSELVSIPLEDIAVIVIDTRELLLTAPLLSECAAGGVAIVVTDTTHLPSGVLLPLLTHSRAFGVMREQIAMSKPLRKRLWRAVVKQKIKNQAAVVEGNGKQRLLRLASEVKSGDPDNREAAAASIYFKLFFGETYLRREDTVITAAQNYGYSILRSALGRALVLHGLLPAIGVHHDNERNAFNLADDLIEPFRPIVDKVARDWCDLNREEVHLNQDAKRRLVSILHQDVTDTATVDGDKRTVLNQIDQTVVSFVRAVKARDPRLIILPELDGGSRR